MGRWAVGLLGVLGLIGGVIAYNAPVTVVPTVTPIVDNHNRVKRMRRSSEIATTATPYTFPAAGLLAYYKFDSTAVDITGNNHNGDVSGSPTYTTGIVGNAIQTASSKMLSCGANPGNLSPQNGTANTAFSISMWIKPTSLADYGSLFASNDSAVGLYTMASGHLNFWDNAHGSDHISTGAVVVTGSWQHVVFSFAGASGAYKFYLNGALLNSASGVAFDISTTANWIGANASGASPFTGAIDETGIWSTELSSTDVTTIYNSGVGTTFPNANQAALCDAMALGDKAGVWDCMKGDGTMLNSSATTFVPHGSPTNTVENGFAVRTYAALQGDEQPSNSAFPPSDFTVCKHNRQVALTNVQTTAFGTGGSHGGFVSLPFELETNGTLFTYIDDGAASTGAYASSASPLPITVNVWYLLCFTYVRTGGAGNNIGRTYVNGVQVGTSSTMRLANTLSSKWSTNGYAGSGGAASATRGEFITYKALSAADIVRLYNTVAP